MSGGAAVPVHQSCLAVLPSRAALGPALGDRHELKPHCLMCDELLARLWAAKAQMVWVTDPRRVRLGASDRAVTDWTVTVILCHHIRLVSAPRCGLIHLALISAGQKLPLWVSCVNQRRDTRGDASGGLHYGIICPYHWQTAGIRWDESKCVQLASHTSTQKCCLFELGMGKNNAAPLNLNPSDLQMTFWIQSQAWDFCPVVLFSLFLLWF